MMRLGGNVRVDSSKELPVASQVASACHSANFGTVVPMCISIGLLPQNWSSPVPRLSVYRLRGRLQPVRRFPGEMSKNEVQVAIVN